MRRSLIALFAGVLVTAAASPAIAATQTVTGKVIDLTCYVMNNKDVGSDHVTQGSMRNPNVGFACDYSCVRWQGMPVGLLTSDGKVYQIVGDVTGNSNAKIAPHLQHTVTITGDVTVIDGVTLLTASTLTMVSAR